MLNKKRFLYLDRKYSQLMSIKLIYFITGKVEIWLNRVTDAMRRTLRLYFSNGVVAYDEMTRDQFLFAFPAQVALCGTQIWWTTEVNIAFERLEEGYENALKDYNRKQVFILLKIIPESFL